MKVFKDKVDARQFRAKEKLNTLEDDVAAILEAIFKKEKLNFQRYRSTEICVAEESEGKFSYSIFDLRSLKQFYPTDPGKFYESEAEAFEAGKKDVDVNFSKTAVLIDGQIVIYQDGEFYGHNYGKARFDSIGSAYENAIFEQERLDKEE